MTSDKKLYKEALEDVRKEFADEIRKTLLVNIEIRDDPEVPARDRINASKNILHIMGTPRPAESRVTSSGAGTTKNPTDWELTPEENERIERIIRENQGN